jgi:hypothetical protein
MFKRILVSTILAFSSIQANAEQVAVASAASAPAGRFLGTALYNGTNTECVVFANPVLAVGPIFGPIYINGVLYNAYYYNCFTLNQPAPIPNPVIPVPTPNRHQPLFNFEGRTHCPRPQESQLCLAWIDPIIQACQDVGGLAVDCPESCVTLCTRPLD